MNRRPRRRPLDARVSARTLRAWQRGSRPRRIRRTSQALAIRYGLRSALTAARRATDAAHIAPFDQLPPTELVDGRTLRAVDRWRAAYLSAYCRAWLRARRHLRAHRPDLEPHIDDRVLLLPLDR